MRFRFGQGGTIKKTHLAQGHNRSGVVLRLCARSLVCVDAYKSGGQSRALVEWLQVWAGGYPDEDGLRETAWMFFHIIKCILAYAEQPGNPVPDTEASLVEFLTRCDPSFVKKHADPNTGLLVDNWNNPIKLVILSPDWYSLVSYGPNGKDDEVEYDDIVVDFDPTGSRDDAVGYLRHPFLAD